MGALVVGILIQRDRLISLRKIVNLSGDLSCSQPGVLPKVVEFSIEQSIVRSRMSCEAESTEFAHGCEQWLPTQIRGAHPVFRVRQMHFPEVPFKLLLARVFGEQADPMNLFSCRNFESRKYHDAGIRQHFANCL